MGQARSVLHVDLYFWIGEQVFLEPANVKVAEYRNLGLMIARRDKSALRAAKPTRRDRAGDLVVVEAQDGGGLALIFVMLTGKH
jgi:hypothetical protein